jgi:hypothetical protein
LEHPALFSNGLNKDGCRPTQVELTESYLRYCRLYPEPLLHKKIRGHAMKMLHRYFVVHTEQRNKTGIAKTLEDYEDICKVSEPSVSVIT